MKQVNIATLFILAACSTAPHSGAQTARWAGQLDERMGIGSCLADSGAVDLNRMMVLENRNLDITSEDGRPVRVEISGDSVSFERLDGDHSTVGYNIGHIAGGDKVLDVELKLVLVENQLAVYWRETFQHRVYRHGLLSVAGERLVRWCEGQGGMTSLPGVVDHTTLE